LCLNGDDHFRKFWCCGCLDRQSKNPRRKNYYICGKSLWQVEEISQISVWPIRNLGKHCIRHDKTRKSLSFCDSSGKIGHFDVLLRKKRGLFSGANEFFVRYLKMVVRPWKFLLENLFGFLGCGSNFFRPFSTRYTNFRLQIDLPETPPGCVLHPLEKGTQTPLFGQIADDVIWLFGLKYFLQNLKILSAQKNLRIML